MASLSFFNFSECSAYEDSEDFWAFFCARAFLTYSGSGFVPTSTGLLSAQSLVHLEQLLAYQVKAFHFLPTLT